MCSLLGLVSVLLVLTACSLPGAGGGGGVAPSPSSAPSATDPPTAVATASPSTAAPSPERPWPDSRASEPADARPSTRPSTEQPFAVRQAGLDEKLVEALVYPVRRNGGTSVLNVLVRAVNADEEFTIRDAFSDDNPELGHKGDRAPDGIRLVDGKHRLAYLPASTSDGVCVCSPISPLLPVTRESQWWVSVTFAAPPETVTSVGVEIPQFGTVSNVLFAKDSAELRPSARRRVAEVGRTIQRSGPGRLRIMGYTDDLGSAAHGLTLSRRRAAAVAKELAKQLPPPDYRMVVQGRGEADPAVANSSEANRKKNRRVVVTYAHS